MSRIITPRRDLILPSRYKQRGFIMNPYRFGGSGDYDPGAAADSFLAKLVAWYDFDSANPHRDDWGVYQLGGVITPVAGKVGNAAPSGTSLRSVIGVPGFGSAGASVGAWMKFATTGARQSFGVGINVGGGEMVSIGCSGAANHSATAFSSSGTGYAVEGSAASAGSYRLLQASVVPSGSLTLHVNGAASGAPVAVGASLRASEMTAIGNLANEGSTADIDSAYVARGPLTDDERALLYNGGAGRALADIIALSSVTVPSCNLGGLTIDRTKYAINYLKNRIGRHGGTGHALVRTTTAHGSGKRWFAVRCDRFAGDFEILGFASALAANTYPGADTNGIGIQFSRAAGVGYYYNGAFINIPSFAPLSADGDVAMLAWDAAAKKVWIGKNGTWRGDPAAGTGELFTFGSSHTLHVGLSLYTGSAKNLAFLMTSADMPYANPSGFTPWGD